MANLGRPILARPERIKVEGANKRNIQSLQKNMRQFQVDQKKQAEAEESNRLKALQFQAALAKQMVANNKFQQDQEDYYRKLDFENKAINGYKQAVDLYTEKIINNPNYTQSDINMVADQYRTLLDSELYDARAKSMIESLAKRSQSLEGSDMLKNREEYKSAQLNGLGFDKKDDIPEASSNYYKYKRIKVSEPIFDESGNIIDDGTRYIQSGINPVMKATQMAKMNALLTSSDPVKDLSKISQDPDFNIVMMEDPDFKQDFQDIAFKIQSNAQELALKNNEGKDFESDPSLSVVDGSDGQLWTVGKGNKRLFLIKTKDGSFRQVGKFNPSLDRAAISSDNTGNASESVDDTFESLTQ